MWDREEIKGKSEFSNKQDFIDYCKNYSIFDVKELSDYYDWKNVFAIKMTYNVALSQRLIRKRLIEEVGMNKDSYWGFFKIDDAQFEKIINLGEINESFIIH